MRQLAATCCTWQGSETVMKGGTQSGHIWHPRDVPRFFINKYLNRFRVARNRALMIAQCSAYDTAKRLRRKARRASACSHNLTEIMQFLIFIYM